jgi:hypothetical protein
MIRRPALTAALAATAVLSTTGCGVLMRFIGDATANLITQKTASLAEVAANVSFTTNLYPTDAKTYETEVMEKAWTKGGNLLNVVFQKRHGVGMWEIEGTVTARKANGPAEPMTYFGKGAYYLMLPPNDRAPRVIEVRTATGQVAQFLAKPAAPVTIKAVNGKAAGATVDLKKDLVLDLADVGPGKLKVMLAATTLGIRTMTDVAIVKPAKRIVVPAAAFRHMGVSASMENFMGVDPGANYVVVERYEGGTIAKPGAAGAAFSLGKAWSHVPVTVVGDVKNAAGKSYTGQAPTPRGPVAYTIHKGPAFYAPPVSRAHKIAVGSLVVRASLFKQDVSVKETSTHRITTTTTYAFPPVAPASWDRLLDDSVVGFANAFKAVGAQGSLIPAERVTASPVYQSMEAVNESLDAKFVERAYRKTRHVFPESAAGLVSSVSSTFANDRPVVRLMHDVGADAVLDGRINLQIGAFEDTKQLALIPAVSFLLVGPANGYAVGPTIYASGQVSATQGVTFSEAELSDVGALRRIARLDDLMTGLRAGLTKLREEERKQGYDAIWALQ